VLYEKTYRTGADCGYFSIWQQQGLLECFAEVIFMPFKDKFKDFQTLNVNSSIILRQADPDKDCLAHYEIFNDVDAFRYYGGVHGDKHSIEKSRKILSNQIKEFEKASVYSWIIADAKTNKTLGRILLSNFEYNNKMANIGYFLGRDSWGKGIISDCIKSVVEFGFSYLELERIYATVHVDNIGSWKALEKNEFLREGLLRHSFNVNNRLFDCYMYSRLNID